jgi:CRP-like cAMP-binding protein
LAASVNLGQMSVPHAELQPRLGLLRTLDLFEPLPGRRLERLAAAVVGLRFAAGAVIVRQGDEGDYFYVVVDGEVEVSRFGRRLARRRAGEYFGEVALLRRVPRMATVLARTPTSLYALEAYEFLGAIAGNPRSAEIANLRVRARTS